MSRLTNGCFLVFLFASTLGAGTPAERPPNWGSIDFTGGKPAVPETPGRRKGSEADNLWFRAHEAAVDQAASAPCQAGPAVKTAAEAFVRNNDASRTANQQQLDTYRAQLDSGRHGKRELEGQSGPLEAQHQACVGGLENLEQRRTQLEPGQALSALVELISFKKATCKKLEDASEEVRKHAGKFQGHVEHCGRMVEKNEAILELIAAEAEYARRLYAFLGSQADLDCAVSQEHPETPYEPVQFPPSRRMPR